MYETLPRQKEAGTAVLASFQLWNLSTTWPVDYNGMSVPRNYNIQILCTIVFCASHASGGFFQESDWQSLIYSSEVFNVSNPSFH